MCNTMLVNPMFSEDLSEVNMQTNRSYPIGITSPNGHQNIMNNYNMESNFLPPDELMDFLSEYVDNIQSTYRYEDQSLYTVSLDK